MPWFDGAAEWLNSGPPGPAELPGHVVLVNFWTGSQGRGPAQNKRRTRGFDGFDVRTRRPA
jgi:hypothetical protein